MMTLALCMAVLNPFSDAHFSSLPSRSVSIFSNPAGCGIQPGAELLFAYHPDRLMSALTLGNIGLGMIRRDSLTCYETGLGYRLPGVFSIGYAYQFGDTAYHTIGLIARYSHEISLGYRTTVGARCHMFGGISIRPIEDYITLSGEIEYEGIDSILNYYYGVILQPMEGIKIHFKADQDFTWHTGLELSFGHAKIAGLYSSHDEKFSAGIILSAQSYKTFLPERAVTTRVRSKEYPSATAG